MQFVLGDAATDAAAATAAVTIEPNRIMGSPLNYVKSKVSTRNYGLVLEAGSSMVPR